MKEDLHFLLMHSRLWLAKSFKVLRYGHYFSPHWPMRKDCPLSPFERKVHCIAQLNATLRCLRRNASVLARVPHLGSLGMRGWRSKVPVGVRLGLGLTKQLLVFCLMGNALLVCRRIC